MRLERHEEPMRRRPREPAGVGKPPERSGTVGQQVKQHNAAIQYANGGDSAGARLSIGYAVHTLNMLSHYLRQC